ncbi:3beta-hydroxysteroid-dehydrogenase/decarboxylase isoform 2 [Zea mays]|uniref:3beta-hydroxysteroid-dehydrogenase/decarboxylase isoform 2 n=1 Tax=Zea mays TaxID=4577 RepID=A0A1D6QLM0_MAIZE|nr:3beta-hydroxysteroid-dehydrogenase/decarboxylase isoform 2 [Zea mays]
MNLENVEPHMLGSCKKVSAALDALVNIAGGRINIHVLMALAAFASIFMGNALEGGLLLVMFNLAHIAEEYFTSKSMFDVRELKENHPEFALLLETSGEESVQFSNLSYTKVPVHDLEVGSHILVRAGEDGLKRTVESYPHLQAQNHRSISKASIFLGNGNLAKTVLWEDAKQTVTVLLLLAVIYYHLFTCGYTFITAMAKLLSLTALFLFIHGMLPSNLYSPLFSFSFVEFTYYQMINWFGHKVSLSLLVVSILSSMSSQAAFIIGTALVFTGFKAYEKWEDSIDSMVGDAYTILLHFGSAKKSSS